MWGKTVILSHRGISANYPENTMLAFRKSYEAGMDGIELDVQFTKDRELVVVHDELLDRTVNATGYVKDFTLKELKTMDAGVFKGEEFKGEQIPTLDEVLEYFQGKEKIINIELKTGVFSYFGIEEKVIECIKKYQLEDYVYITSFNHLSIARFQGLTKKIESGILIYDTQFDIQKYAKTYNQDIVNPSIEYFDLCRETFLSMISKGKKITIYTEDKPEKIRELISLGINVITNIEITS
ncbi:MAG: glycerophosphodiester phosphodiesterase [Psychrilyobacter sp.]|nr:glycerophosphodiester phosphodiesterase [Psychrilyobacter sp.]